jgi:hypothetical protein
VTYLRELESELAAAGVRGRVARRVLEEARDHLAELDTETRFGEPRRIALEVAAVVATSQTRRAAFATFAALAATGVGYLVAFGLVAHHGWPDVFAGQVVGLGIAAALGIMFLPQLTFVAGCLMLVRVFRLARPAPVDELRLVRRRAAIALAGALATLAAWALFALEFRGEIAAGSVAPTIVVLSAALVLPLLATSAAVRAAARPRAAAGGPAGDVFDDLEPFVARTPLARVNLRAHPWRFAVGFALAVGIAATVIGSGEDGLAGGLARGVPEALAVLVFFALFGRILGLRPR